MTDILILKMKTV